MIYLCLYLLIGFLYFLYEFHNEMADWNNLLEITFMWPLGIVIIIMEWILKKTYERKK